MTLTAEPAAPPAAADAAAGGSKKKLIIAVVVLLLAAGAGYQLVLKKGGTPPPPEPGEVLVLEPIQLNLEGGHYLRLGLALQLTADAHEADGSMALDHAISLLSGLSVKELGAPAEREKLKAELTKELEHAYHGDVMEVYFTEFVTQ